jgi:hypothetical protein
MRHAHRQSLGRELDRAAAAKYERIESIGFSSWLLAIMAVPCATADSKFQAQSGDDHSIAQDR